MIMKYFIYITLLILWTIEVLQAQQGRYQQAVFSQKNVQTNIQYGTADSYDALGLNFPAPQYLDFYEPLGDTATKRPLVLVFFGGAFLIGDKSMQDVVAWCDSLTSYGYTCAAVNYRIGFNVLSSVSSIRAGYRGVQDARAAVRYMKEFHQQFRIDTNLIFMVGNSAGTINAMQAAYSSESDRPIETYGVASTLDDNTDLGCLDCSGNAYQHTVDVAGVVGCWGAVIDLGGLDTTDKAPILMFHGTDDAIVPIDSGVPFSASAVFPTMYGSRQIHQKRLQLGLPSELHVYPGKPHNFYYDGILFPNTYWDTLWSLAHPFLCDINPYCQGQSMLSHPSIANTGELFSIHPNPASTTIVMEFLKEARDKERQITLYSIQGQTLATHYTRAKHFSLDIQGWERGVYIIVVDVGGEQYQQKVVIH